MVKPILLTVLFVFVTSNAFAEGGSTAPKVFVSKEKTEVQESNQTTKTSEFKGEQMVSTEKKQDSQVEKSSAVEENATEKKTRGTVTGVNGQGFAVEYAVDKKEGGMEIWFNYNEGMKLIGIHGSSELEEGDAVKVTYDETPSHRRIIKEIELIRKKPEEPKEKAPETKVPLEKEN